MSRPLICGFLKARNEIVIEGNIYRVVANMRRYCDTIVACDDASTDGTREFLQSEIPADQLVLVPPQEHDFTKELRWKQRMLEIVHRIQPYWVQWMDADEVYDRAGTDGLRAFLEGKLTAPEQAWSYHYSQLWRSSTWARTDAGFDDGWFLKSWKWSPDLEFEIREDGPYGGLHHPQFPRQIMQAYHQGLVGRAPFEQIHYGNYGSCLRWKCIRYWGGLGGVDRHLRFERAEYRAVDPCLLPDGAEQAPVLPPAHHQANLALNTGLFLPNRPRPFSPAEIERILALGNMRDLTETFTVVIPAYNRADTLDRALQSLLDQTYERWVAVVLDDGSIDETPALMRYWQDRDPRIFYARYPENRGGVAMNELGMSLSCEWTSWWTRLGSDDYFGPTKLARDAFALRDHDACFGAYQVLRDGQFMEVCNGPAPAADIREALLGKRFAVSWANCAVRTSVLQAVRARYGHFCDPRIRNMEDFLVNARIVRQSRGWVWRGMVDGMFVVNPTAAECRAIIERFTARRAVDELEAVWTCVTTGASGNLLQSTKDENLTRELITRDTIATERT